MTRQPHKAHSWWKAFLPNVLQAGLLQEKPARLANGRSYAALSVSPQGHSVMQSELPRVFRLSPVPSELAPPPPKPAPVALRSSGLAAVSQQRASHNSIRSEGASEAFLDAKKQELYRRLSHIRQQWMRRLNLMGESLMSNPVLRMLAEVRPSSVQVAQLLDSQKASLVTTTPRMLLDAPDIGNLPFSKDHTKWG